MHLSEIFIRRPIATSLLMAGIALFRVIAYRALPVSDLPQVDYPTITVSASLPGANPDTMASAEATPLERPFTSIARPYSIISKSSHGCGSRAGGYQRAGGARDRAQRDRCGAAQLEREPAHRYALRSAHRVQRSGERPVDEGV